jgi:hypothetical protein
VSCDPVTRLPDGRVLVAGGWVGEYQTSAAIPSGASCASSIEAGD